MKYFKRSKNVLDMIMYHFNKKTFTEELYYVFNRTKTRNQTGKVSATFFGADIHHSFNKLNFSFIKCL